MPDFVAEERKRKWRRFWGCVLLLFGLLWTTNFVASCARYSMDIVYFPDHPYFRIWTLPRIGLAIAAGLALMVLGAVLIFRSHRRDP